MTQKYWGGVHLRHSFRLPCLLQPKKMVYSTTDGNAYPGCVARLPLQRTPRHPLSMSDYAEEGQGSVCQSQSLRIPHGWLHAVIYMYVRNGWCVYCKQPSLQSLLQDAGLLHHRCQIWLTVNQGAQRKYVVRNGGSGGCCCSCWCVSQWYIRAQWEPSCTKVAGAEEAAPPPTLLAHPNPYHCTRLHQEWQEHKHMKIPSAFRCPSAHHELLQMLYMLRTFISIYSGVVGSSSCSSQYRPEQIMDPLWGHEHRTRCCQGGWSDSPCDDHENGGQREMPVEDGSIRPRHA